MLAPSAGLAGGIVAAYWLWPRAVSRALARQAASHKAAVDSLEAKCAALRAAAAKHGTMMNAATKAACELSVPPLPATAARVGGGGGRGTAPEPSRRNRRQRKRREPLLRDSAYPDAAPHDFKASINAAFSSLLSSLHPDLGSAAAAGGHGGTRGGNVVLLLDAPSFRTTRAVAHACGVDLQRAGGLVIVPQYDLVHYVSMVNDPDVYVGVRLQRLDHWLCVNGPSGGFAGRVCGFFADYETGFKGHQEKRLSPAADCERFFRWNYPADECALAITWNLHNGESVAEVVAFVSEEAAANGFACQLVESWSYGLGCALFHLTREERILKCS